MSRLAGFALTAALVLPHAATAKPKPPHFAADSVTTEGTVAIGGAPIAYTAVAGTIVVHPKGFDDAASPPPDKDGEKDADKDDDKPDKDADKNPDAEASMFYAAYFKKGDAGRPLTFVFNGGPGSATVWLHMGAFGPVRVAPPDAIHGPAAPYALVPNDQSLLDATDLVFIDAPGAGFSRIAGHDHDKAFFGVDEDAHAFAEFITTFLSQYGRWNSPKYVFGESYGTTRAAALANLLEEDRAVDLNGVIMLSQILNFGLSPDGADGNPGVDLPYILALPTYAATAFYHHRLDAAVTDLATLVADAEAFATGGYASALAEGAALAPDRRAAVIARLHDLTGLAPDYLDRANLRVTGGEFEQALQLDRQLTTGRLDSRYAGPVIDPMAKEADYDPQGAAIGSAYIAAFNDYARKTLKYGEGRAYKLFANTKHWNFRHKPPGADEPIDQAANVMPDLARAMKVNPALRVQLNAGYFDLATPFYVGQYEMRHLPMPAALQANIEYRQYASGHMVYANPDALRALHDNVAAFIARTRGP